MSSQSPAAMALQILLDQEREISRLFRVVNIKYEKRIAELEKELKGTQIARESELVHIKSLEKALKDLAELAHMSHTYCEDSWYSCPKAEDGCADESRGPECDCGAVEHNAKIDAIRSSAGYVGEGDD